MTDTHASQSLSTVFQILTQLLRLRMEISLIMRGNAKLVREDSDGMIRLEHVLQEECLRKRQRTVI